METLEVILVAAIQVAVETAGTAAVIPAAGQPRPTGTRRGTTKKEREIAADCADL